MPNTDYNIDNIATIVKGKIIASDNDSSSIKYIVTDSRSIITPEESIFFSLVGKRNDGHKYIGELYEKGIKNFIISSVPDDISKYPEANFIQVKSTLKALQQLVVSHRKKHNIPVIGVTGSNGKTIVKEWLYQLLSGKLNIVRSPKSYNSQIGVPLSVWQLNSETEAAVFEAGISEPDEMTKLQPIINPTIGIFTNIGQAHAENFFNEEQKVGEKLKLFTKVKTLIYCSDHSSIKNQIIRSQISQNIEFFTWSRKSESDLKIHKIVKRKNESTIYAYMNQKLINITIPFSDNASIENAIHCWCLMLLMGYDGEYISESMLKLNQVAMRLELKEGINHCSIINDSYNSDYNSLGIAIDFLNQQKQHDKKTIILSDILQSGRTEMDLYEDVANLLAEKEINRIIGIGKAIKRQSRKFNIEKKFYTTTEEFINSFSFSSFRNEAVLLKGARVFCFEQIGKMLQQKSHETILEINLNAIVSNLNYYRSIISPETKIIAMVKAFSYGSGSYEIANVLQHHNIDYLAVAYVDEGIELRKAGITVPIMVMNPEEQSFDTMIRYNLEPEIFSLKILSQLNKALIRNKAEEISVHLKLDTGMHRLGFEKKDFPALFKELKTYNSIKVKSIFSHLAASEAEIHDDFTHGQINTFSAMGELIKKELGHSVSMHILNSAGISRFRDSHFDMVRLGIGLYGVSSVPNDNEFLQNVCTLKTTVLQIKEVAKGQTIGYGREAIAQKNLSIAVLPIGFADGLNRQLSNGKGKLMVNGELAPIVGNICMDLCMIDISGLSIKEGEEVLVFGNDYPLSELASQQGTIPYEILSGISRRVKRVYFHE